MFTDEQRRTVGDQIRQHDLRAVTRFLPVGLMTDVARQGGAVGGRHPLYLVNRVWLGVASAWHTSKNFADLLVLTRKRQDDSGALPATEWAAAKRGSPGRLPSGRWALGGQPPRATRPMALSLG